MPDNNRPPSLEPQPNLGLAQGARDPGDDFVCIPNISTAERRKRLAFGVAAFAIGLAILAALVVTGAARLWRLLLFIPFFSAASGFFQWRDET